MSRLALLFRTDTHVSDRSPVSWKGDYPSEIWSNLEQVGVLAKVHGVSAVLDGGDYFHIKAASRNSHALVERTARIHKEYPCKVWCVEGNHDMAYNNLETIEKQPLGVLYASHVFEHLRETVFEQDGLKVRVVGLPYSPFRKLEELQALKKRDEDCLIAVVHQLAGADPPDNVEEFFGEPVFRYSDLVSSNGPDAFLFGHWHKDQGVVVNNGKYFVNHGALSRGALNKENVDRKPQVSLLEITSSGLSVVTIPLDVAPAEDVFDFEKKERSEKEDVEIENFVGRLKNNVDYDASCGIEENLSQMSFAKEIRDLALDYLEQARSQVG
jgi:DNA repair exonuclease SbcCD nuclease subunit